jgi:hypothetical protein
MGLGSDGSIPVQALLLSSADKVKIEAHLQTIPGGEI